MVMDKALQNMDALGWETRELEDILVSLYETQPALPDRQLAQLQTAPAPPIPPPSSGKWPSWSGI